MRFVNRKAIGLEEFFASRSSSFADLYDFTDSELEEHLEYSPWRVRFPISQIIRLALVQLRDDRIELEGLVPDEIYERYCDSTNTDCSAEYLRGFFDYLVRLQRENEQARVSRIAEISNCSMHLDRDARLMFANFFSLDNQRVIVSADGSTVTMMTAEREWGRTKFVFSGCDFGEMPPMPLMGFAFGLESMLLDDGRFEAKMLIDTEFTDEDYYKRLLSDSGWQEFSFVFRNVGIETLCYDYIGRMERLGTPRFEMIERACKLLLSKSAVLGCELMTAKEREMLPAAGLINGAVGLTDSAGSFDDRYNEDQIIEALENRYAIACFESLLEESGCGKLYETVKAAENACYEDDENTAIKKAEAFAVEFKKCAADGTARCLIYKLSEMLHSMTEGLEENPYRADAERQIIERVRDTAHPVLDSMGFCGSFPHYRRQRSEEIEYISIMLDSGNDRPHRGRYSYFASVAAAKMPVERCEELRKAGVNIDSINALDCLPESLTVSQYGELASDDDREFVQFEVNCGSKDAPLLRDESDRLPHYIGLAEEQFTRGCIPAYYRRKRFRAGNAFEAFYHACFDYLPCGIGLMIVMLIAYLLMRRVIGDALPATAACLYAAEAGTLLVLVLSIIRCIRKSLRLWRY